MVGINISYAKSQVRRVIASAPTKVNNYRQDWLSDGFGGRIKDGAPKPVGEGFYALFDNASSPKINILVSMGGKQEQENGLRLFAECGEGVDPRIDDTWVHNGITYRFSNVTNILELDVLYEITLEIKED